MPENTLQRKPVLPSSMPKYGLDISDYHTILLESRILRGEIKNIHRVSPHDLRAIIEGPVSLTLIAMTARCVVQIIQHDDGKTIDFVSHGLSFPSLG